MPVLVTSKFDDDSVKNECASMETQFYHYKSTWNFLDAQGQLIPSQWFDLAEIRTRPRFYACPCYLQVWKGSDQKQPRKRWRHHFPHYKSMGAFCCHGHQSFDPICLKTLCSLSPPPVMLHIKFDQDWPTGLRDIQVWKWKNFRHSRPSNSKVSSLIRPKIGLIRAFMPVLVTNTFDDNSIKNKQASMETAFSHYNSMGNFLDAQGQHTP